MKVFVAIPIDSGFSKPSRDFKAPKKIGDHEVEVHYNDTIDIVCTTNHNYSYSRQDKINFAHDRICLYKVALARQKLIDDFLKTDCDKLLFIDSDIIVDGNDLISLVESNELVATTTSCYRSLWGKKRVTENQISMGGIIIPLWCTTIKREVFDKLTPPYFDNGKNHREDAVFTEKLKEAKIPNKCYYDIDIGHQCRETGKIYYFNKKRTEIMERNNGCLPEENK